MSTLRHRPDQHRRAREHLRRRHAHDEAHRARPVEVHACPTSIAAPRLGAAPEGQPVVRERDHARSSQANCASCHNPGQVGAAHWTLDDRRRRRQDLRRHRVGGRGRVHAAVAGVAARRRRCWTPSGSTRRRSTRSSSGRMPAVRSTCRRRRRSRPTGGPAVPAPRARRGAADAAGVRRVVERPERLPLLRPRSALHQADVHHRLPGHARPSRRDPPRRRSSTSTRRRSRPRPRSPAATASPGGVATARSISRRPQRHDPFGGTRHPPGFTGQAGLVAGWVPGPGPGRLPRTLRDPVAARRRARAADPLPLRHHAGARPHDGRRSRPTPAPTTSRRSTSSTRSRRSRSRACRGVTAPLCNRNAALADDVTALRPHRRRSPKPGLLGLCGETSEQLAAHVPQRGRVHDLQLPRCPSRGRSCRCFGHEHTLGQDASA